MYSGRGIQCTGNHIYGRLDPIALRQQRGPLLLLRHHRRRYSIPVGRIHRDGWTARGFGEIVRSSTVRHHYMLTLSNPQAGKRFGLLALSMNTNSKVGKHLPMDEISPGGIQRDNEDKHGGRRGESCDMIQMSDTDSLTQSRIRARRKKAESSSADRPRRYSTKNTTRRQRISIRSL